MKTVRVPDYTNKTPSKHFEQKMSSSTPLKIFIQRAQNRNKNNWNYRLHKLGTSKVLRTDGQTEGRTDGVDRLLDLLLLSNDRLYNKIHAAKWHIKFFFQDLKPACQQRKKQLVDKNKLSNCLVLVMKINTHELRSLYIFLKPIQNITQYIFICYSVSKHTNSNSQRN